MTLFYLFWYQGTKQKNESTNPVNSLFLDDKKENDQNLISDIQEYERTEENKITQVNEKKQVSVNDYQNQQSDDSEDDDEFEGNQFQSFIMAQIHIHKKKQ